MPLQLHQNLNLLLFLVIGFFTAHISLSWEKIGFILLFTLFIEHLFLYFNTQRSFYFSYSALSTAIGVIVLLYSSSLWVYFVVITLGLAQKHFLNFEQRHLFNPSNFALLMALFLFYKESHIIAGQFGDNQLFSMLVFVLALTLLVRVKRWLIPLFFILFYLFFQYLFVLPYDLVLTFDAIVHRFYSVSFMLFVYFMLTDPSVTPSSWQGQLLFTLSITLMIALLDRYYGFRLQHLFMSVFFCSFFVHYPLFKKLSITQLKLLVTILLFIIVMLVDIELQPPYYFEMNG